MTAPVKTTKQQRGRPFPPGRSGNPRGRPEGSRNKTTLALEALLDGQAERLTQRAIDLALAGDTVALRICLDRLLPARRERSVALSLPAIKAPADAVQAMGAIVAAVAAGEISPTEADAVAALVEKFVRAIEVSDLAERVAELEAKTWQQI